MYHQEQNERMSHRDSMRKRLFDDQWILLLCVDVIWRKYMAGWREVCDECTTTLFNYHYMCKQCGYMICVECANQFSQLSIEKRKSNDSFFGTSRSHPFCYLELKRTCTHDTSYILSEFIPWESMYTSAITRSNIVSFLALVVLKLRNSVIDYLSRLKLDYSIKLYNSAKSEHLSAFIKSLKMRRAHDSREIKKVWSTSDCNDDPDIEFYCHGRLPVFNRWNTDNTKQVEMNR